MILIGMGANLPSHTGSPAETIRAALQRLPGLGLAISAVSPLYESPSWPHGEGPPFINAVVKIETKLAPGSLLFGLQKIETEFGRQRGDKWGPRTLDLDILDYHGMVTDTETLLLPHPWICERAFVLKPLLDVSPAWCHPVSGKGVVELLTMLDGAAAASCQPIGELRA